MICIYIYLYFIHILCTYTCLDIWYLYNITQTIYIYITHYLYVYINIEMNISIVHMSNIHAFCLSSYIADLVEPSYIDMLVVNPPRSSALQIDTYQRNHGTPGLTLWVLLTVRHGIDGPLKQMVYLAIGFSMANCYIVITRWYIYAMYKMAQTVKSWYSLLVRRLLRWTMVHHASMVASTVELR